MRLAEYSPNFCSQVHIVLCKETSMVAGGVDGGGGTAKDVLAHASDYVEGQDQDHSVNFGATIKYQYE